MEYVDGGDLQFLMRMKKTQNEKIPETDLLYYTYQTAQALDYMHQKNIIHADVKLNNLLLTSNKIVKLCDFGVSQVLKSAYFQRNKVGTPLFVSPEVLTNQPYNEKADVWGLGCAVYFLATFEAPFSGKTSAQLNDAIINKQPEPIPADRYSEDLIKLVDKLLHKDQIHRPSTKEIMWTIENYARSNYKDTLY